ncbi:MAG: DUF58 domain-containing protein [Puniceicoccales bacterium]|jgi:uncharacterized protein (DUF58 family)|nr:DUF58 domain-containing protein [Puniceicoccales bacterium]
MSVPVSDGGTISNVDHFCTARRGELYGKQFTGERDFSIMFAIDVSSSQMFGSTVSKIDFALKLAGKLSEIAHEVGDKAGLILFSEDVELYKPAYAHLCIPSLEMHKIGLGSDPKGVVKFLQNILKPSSIVFFVSDFLYPDRIRNDLMEALKNLSKRHDLICVQLLDRVNLSIPPIGRLRLQDSESLDCVSCNSSDGQFSRIYANIDGKWTGKLEKDAKKVGLKFVAIENGCSEELAMEKCLDKRLAYA